MATMQQMRRDLDRRRARTKILESYLDAYEMLADTNTFSNANMAGKSAARVAQALKREQEKVQQLRRQINGDR